MPTYAVYLPDGEIKRIVKCSENDAEYQAHGDELISEVPDATNNVDFHFVNGILTAK